MNLNAKFLEAKTLNSCVLIQRDLSSYLCQWGPDSVGDLTDALVCGTRYTPGVASVASVIGEREGKLLSERFRDLMSVADSRRPSLRTARDVTPRTVDAMSGWLIVRFLICLLSKEITTALQAKYECFAHHTPTLISRRIFDLFTCRREELAHLVLICSFAYLTNRIKIEFCD